MTTISKRSLSAAVLALGASAQAATVGYWRFEDGSNLGADSGLNSLTLTNANSVAAVTTPFTTPVPQTGAANTGAASFAVASTRYLWALDAPAFAPAGDGDFTVESYVNLTSAGSGSTVRAITGQLSGTSGWQFAITGTGSGLGARNLLLQMTDSTGSALTSFYVPLATSTAFQIVNGTNYYVAASVDFVPTAITPRTDVTFYLKNLDTNADLVSHTISSTAVSSLVNSSARFAIGATYSSGTTSTRHFDGRLDEVRLSTGALGTSSLLVSVPEPASMTVLASALCLFVVRRRAGR